MSGSIENRTVEKLLRQQAALATFGSFAFRESALDKILAEAARVCALSLGVSFCKVCCYREAEDDLLIVAGCGWHSGVVGQVVSQANESSPQGRAYVTGVPVVIRNLHTANNLALPPFYKDHGIVSTVDVLIPSTSGRAYGVLEVDSPTQHQYDEHDITFLTGFANVLAEAVATARRIAEINDLLASRNLMAQELQHRVRNNLHMISMMLDSQARNTVDRPAREGVELISRRVTSLSQVYDSLLGVGLSRTIDLAHYLRALCLTLPELQADRIDAVHIGFTGDSVLLGLDEVTSIGMVVAELVSNSFKHAFPGRSGIIRVHLSHPVPGNAILTVSDDGIGFVPRRNSKGYGSGLMSRLMTQAAGTIEIKSDAAPGGHGTTSTLAFEVPVAVN